MECTSNTRLVTSEGLIRVFDTRRQAAASRRFAQSSPPQRGGRINPEATGFKVYFSDGGVYRAACLQAVRNESLGTFLLYTLSPPEGPRKPAGRPR